MLKKGKLLEVFADLLGAVLIAGVVLNFSNALMRYGFGASLVWAEEIMTFGLILIVMLGIIVITARSEHLKIDAAVQLFSSRLQHALRIFANLMICAALVYIAIQSLSIVQLMMRLGQTSVAARIPMWIPHSFLLVSFSLAALAALYRAAADFHGFFLTKTTDSPEDNGELT